jgi:hypothetical protein
LGGRPVEVAQTLVDRLCGRNEVDVSLVCSRRSLPTWERFFKEEWKAKDWIQKALATSTTVRHPAPGMAYVMLLLTHPDQTEAFTIDKETLVSAEVVSLLYDQEIHDWRVHSVGGMAPPSDVGLVAFPRSDERGPFLEH